MPTVKILNIKPGKLGIWKFRETASELQPIFQFTEKEQKEFQNFKTDNRKREFLSVRILLEKMMDKKTEIHYNSHGKPEIKEPAMHISISHSADLAVVLVSEKNAGVDVENIHRNTEKIAKRFLSDVEMYEIQQSDQPNLQRIIYWCAKEAAFKFSVLPEIDFKSHITIRNFKQKAENGVFIGQISKNLPPINLTFHYFFYENNVIVFCVEKEKNKK